jgi:hypothetical protein
MRERLQHGSAEEYAGDACSPEALERQALTAVRRSSGRVSCRASIGDSSRLNRRVDGGQQCAWIEWLTPDVDAVACERIGMPVKQPARGSAHHDRDRPQSWIT